jgi:hypothetical protein
MDGRPIFLRLSYDGTNVLYSYSRDGVEFRTCITEAKTTCFTTAPNQVGVSIYADGTTLQTYCISYKKT